jgi:hypothetical protein
MAGVIMVVLGLLAAEDLKYKSEQNQPAKPHQQ